MAGEVSYPTVLTPTLTMVVAHSARCNTSVGHLSLLNTPPSSDHISGLIEKGCTANGVDSKVIHSASGDVLKEKGKGGCEMNAIVRV